MQFEKWTVIIFFQCRFCVVKKLMIILHIYKSGVRMGLDYRLVNIMLTKYWYLMEEISFKQFLALQCLIYKYYLLFPSSAEPLPFRQWMEITNWAASWQNQQCGCAPSENSDQLGQQPSLIRVFAVRMKRAWVLSYPSSAREDSDQTGRMPRLIWVFAGRTATVLVLSQGGSILMWSLLVTK